MTEQQIPKPVASLVEHQARFSGLLVEDGQGVIQNTPDAIALCAKAIGNRRKEDPEVLIDPLIRVDRTIRPAYPGWVTVMHPDLEAIGPTEFDVGRIEQWLHPNQKVGVAKGEVIYGHLKKNDMLASCLGLRDLEEIQKRGIAFFRKHFRGKAIFGWRSVVRGRRGGLLVPYLIENGGEGELRWDWLDDYWNARNPALRFAS